MARLRQLACVAGVIAAAMGANANALGQTNGISRLLNRADVLETNKSDTGQAVSIESNQDSFVTPAAALVPSDHFNKVRSPESVFKPARHDRRRRNYLSYAAVDCSCG